VTARSQEEANLKAFLEEVTKSKEFLQAELLGIEATILDKKAELEDYKKKQQAVNEAILR